MTGLVPSHKLITIVQMLVCRILITMAFVMSWRLLDVIIQKLVITMIRLLKMMGLVFCHKAVIHVLKALLWIMM